jgi:transposase
MGLPRLTIRKGILLRKIVLRLERRVKFHVRRLRRETRDKALAMRCQIVLLVAKGRRRPHVAEAVGCSVSWVNRVVCRFDEHGLPSLVDRREDNGQQKIDEQFLSVLYQVVDQSPQDYGYARPTWTRELLAEVMWRILGIKVHVTTLGRALKRIKARLGRPRPTVGCPWPKSRRNKRLRQIRAIMGAVPPEEAAVYLDEVDIHLNPKIGPDWMNRGTQKEVQTPGQNVKRYLCGALDARTGRMIWVKAERKNSLLFIAMLHKLVKVYAESKVIHIVLDNFKIHDSRASRVAVAALDGKVVLHFLPPYCPSDNRIERVWLDLHANVTRNHRCRDMEQLMQQVVGYLTSRNRRKRENLCKAA